MAKRALGTNPLKQTLFRRTERQPKGGDGDASPPGAAELPPASGGETDRDALPDMQIVVFRVGGSRFGIDVRQASCVVRIVEITRVPGTPEHMLGIVDLRGQIVPVMSLGKLFGWSPPVDALTAYIVVADADGRTMGVIADSLEDLREVKGSELESPGETDRLAHLLLCVAKLADGIVFVLDPAKIAPKAKLAGLDGLLPLPDQGQETPGGDLSQGDRAILRRRALELRQVPEDEEAELQQFLTFALGKDKYAVDVQSVQRVLAVPPIATVPGTPRHFVGVINYAGAVVWLVNLRELFDMPAVLLGNYERVVVIESRGSTLGLLADGMCEVVTVPISAVRAGMGGTDSRTEDYAAAEVYWEGDLIAVLDLSPLSEEPVAGSDGNAGVLQA